MSENTWTRPSPDGSSGGRLQRLRPRIVTILRFAFDSGWLIGISDQVVVSGGNFFSGMIVARTCSQAEFGLFVLGMTVVYLLIDIHLCVVSTPQAILSHQFEGTSQIYYTGSTIVHQVLLSFACSSVLGAVSLMYAQIYDNAVAISQVLVAIAAFVMFTLLREYWRRFFFMRDRISKAFFLDIGVAFCQVAALIGIAFLSTESASAAHAAIGVICGCFAVPLSISLRKEFRVSGRRIWPDFKANFCVGGWILTNSVLWSVGLYAYPWLLATMHGAQATAIWAACMGIIAIINISLVGISNVLTPRIFNAWSAGGMPMLRRYIFTSSLKYVGLTLAVASLPITAGEFLVTLVYGPQYRGSYGTIVILGVNAIFTAASCCASRGLMVAGRANWDLAINLGTLIVVFTFGWWSTATYGSLGAAIGLTVANAIGAVIRIGAFEAISRPVTTGGHGPRQPPRHGPRTPGPTGILPL